MASNLALDGALIEKARRIGKTQNQEESGYVRAA